MGKKKKSSSSSTTPTTTTTETKTDVNNNNSDSITNGAVFDPFAGLEESQIDAHKEFKEKLSTLELDDKEKLWIDDMLIFRYLRARDYNVKAAFELFQGTLKWRKEFKPDEINPDKLSYEASSGKQYCGPFTTKSRPLITMAPRKENTKNYERQIQLLVYTIERAITKMDASQGCEQLAILIDFNGYSIMNAPPLSVSKQTLDILSSHYPERLGVAFIVDPPLVFSVFWNIISPLINKNTVKKIVFVKGEKEKKKVLSQYFESEQLETAFGGTSDYQYDHAVHWKQEIEFYRNKNNLPPLSDEEITKILELKD
ncbi:cellular retinaldehyde-binding/triple function domain-containing protein [Cavenderia fasciculata]|uniref:Cellular retinaldehyde-binding/triple function domain-containing protein n=1 Tax=Cavenderia fasciculata TaxID=261658 RepID=F4PNR2_CACFS|nr:cellular retinaldehyde-binding/triple function domain-containing protein [Cavenderia fasciculata]EGG23115.1 cellular retinaldehyde-binding/triple function domain-containing protein [Cavenderia fasciculata]|eukprot:XP_004360966.1 cellular retinaldehyde-binding/triple function domain-containing protein [Cavenderia fasciculata]